MAEYSRMAKGSFTATGTSQVVVLPFQPDFVELWNYSNIKTAANNSVTRAWWDNKLVDGSNNPTMLQIYNNTGATVFDTIQSNGISTFSGGIAQQYGAAIQIASTTKATNLITTASAHGYNVGDTIVMQGLALNQTTNDYQLLNGVPFTIVTVPSTTTFTVNWNTNQSTYTALSGSPAGSVVKKVLYPFLYLPQDNVITSVTVGSTQTVISTSMYHNFEIGQEVAFRVPNIWGMTQLNSLPNLLIPGQPLYYYVTSTTGTVNAVVLDNWNFAVNLNSSAFTAFTTNFVLPSATLAGLTYAQAVPVGDVNTGGKTLTSSSPLYPSPQFPIPNNGVPTINGPAIRGAFVNNTSQGFLIGPGVAAVDVSAAVTMIANTNIVYWHAYLHDFANP